MGKCNSVSIVCLAYAIVKVIKHESVNVDGARGGSQEDNESKKIENIPALWHDNKLFVHIIPRNRDLRHVVKQVLDENLQSGRWLVRQQALAIKMLKTFPKFDEATISIYLIL
jgi:hypothetical protein